MYTFNVPADMRAVIKTHNIFNDFVPIFWKL